MHSRTILSAAAFSSVAFAQIDQPIPSADAEGIASLINEAIPTEYQGLIPSVRLDLSPGLLSRSAFKIIGLPNSLFSKRKSSML